MNQLSKFYQGRRVLVTGCHGFKGGWLSTWLKQMGAHVYGLGIDSKSGTTFFPEVFDKVVEIDVRESDQVSDFIGEVKPETVFHLAAQPIVLVSLKSPYETFSINVMGTVSILDACGKCDIPRVVVITSDKCYSPTHLEVTESSPLGGRDPYSASKACSELVCEAFRCSYGMDIRTVRAGNVIGGGDASPFRIVPDLIRAWRSGQPLIVRNPSHTRPWQHVLDCCAGYLTAGMASEFPRSINIGPVNESFTVRELFESMGIYIPIISQYCQTPNSIESKSLSLDTGLAKSVGVVPVLKFSEAVHMTAMWYKAEHEKCDMLSKSIDQINQFTDIASALGVGWLSDSDWLSNLTP